MRLQSEVAFLELRHRMNSTTTGAVTKPAVERYFYSAAALLLLGLTVLGFQLFYFHGQAYPGRPLTPPIKTLIITHGIAMSLWISLAIVQPLLVANGNRRVHMTIGKVAAIFAIALVVLGFMMGISAERFTPPDMMFGELTPKQFMAIPILSIVLFAGFVAAGVWWRKRPEIHRPMMFMASMTVVGAAIARIVPLNNLYYGTMWHHIFGDLFFTTVIGAVFVIAKCVLFRKIDRWFVAAYFVMALWFLMIAQGAKTPLWDKIASFLLQ